MNIFILLITLVSSSSPVQVPDLGFLTRIEYTRLREISFANSQRLSRMYSLVAEFYPVYRYAFGPHSVPEIVKRMHSQGVQKLRYQIVDTDSVSREEMAKFLQTQFNYLSRYGELLTLFLHPERINRANKLFKKIFPKEYTRKSFTEPLE